MNAHRKLFQVVALLAAIGIADRATAQETSTAGSTGFPRLGSEAVDAPRTGFRLAAPRALVARSAPAEDEDGHGANHLGYFIGDTTDLDGHHSWTVGIEYVRLLNKTVGVGVLGEAVFADGAREYLVGGILTLAPAKGLTLLGGAGVMFIDYEDDHGTKSGAVSSLTSFGLQTIPIGVKAGGGDKSDTEKFFVRAGMSYVFPIGHYYFGPAAYVDFIDGEEFLVVGLMGVASF